jgi:hypothetical protein
MKRGIWGSGIISLFILFFARDSIAQNCPDDSLLNFGTIDAHWFYRNESLKISLQLPSGWYMYDYHGTDKKYIRIGSDYRKMSSDLFAEGGGGAWIQMSELKKLPIGVQPSILSLSKIADTASIVLSPEEKHDTSITFNVAFADTTDIQVYLKTYYKKIRPNDPVVPEIKDGRIGDLDYKYISVPALNRAGLEEQNLFCGRNFGCINLTIRITYLNASGRSQIFGACKELKSGQ